MNSTGMINFLMENSVYIKSEITGNCMIADEMYELGGEFVVYTSGKEQKDLYRGTDFETAMKVLEGKE